MKTSFRGLLFMTIAAIAGCAGKVPILRADWGPDPISDVFALPKEAILVAGPIYQPRQDFDEDDDKLNTGAAGGVMAVVDVAGDSDRVARQTGSPPIRIDTPPTVSSVDPLPSLAVNTGLSGADASIAVGKQFVVIAQDHQITFLDKATGLQLTPNAAGFPTSMTGEQFFAAFLASKDAGGQANPASVNRAAGFPLTGTTCNVEQAPPQFPCIVEIYDMNVHYDRGSGRFYVAANVRNKIWKDDPPSNPGGSLDALVRRYVAIAVSRSEDPREGFHQYLVLENNYFDFPWLAVTGDAVLVSHVNVDAADNSLRAGYVFSALDVTSGLKDPRRYRLWRSELGGTAGYRPVTTLGETAGFAFLFHPASAGTYEVYGLPSVSVGWTAPSAIKVSFKLNEAFGCGKMSDVIYRADKLYISNCKVADSTSAIPRFSVRVLRIPLQWVASTLTASLSPADGFLDRYFGYNATSDAPDDRVSYERPAIAVNKAGDMILVYGRVGVTTAVPLKQEVRYSIWRAGSDAPLRSQMLMASPSVLKTGATMVTYVSGGVDYGMAAVDSSDDETFWITHMIGDPAVMKLNVVTVGKVKP